jgi:CDGSH-type Zn-finger protein
MEETVSSETIVEATPNGPLLIFGNITIKDAKGETHKKSKVTALCRCGHSENKPFCDGAHNGHFEHDAIAFDLPPKKV